MSQDLTKMDEENQDSLSSTSNSVIMEEEEEHNGISSTLTEDDVEDKTNRKLTKLGKHQYIFKVTFKLVLLLLH